MSDNETFVFEPEWIKPFDLGKHGPLDTVVLDQNGNYFFSDEVNHRILKFSSNGQHILTFGSKGSGDLEFNYPMGLLIYEDKLYVCDSWNHRIQVYHTSGQFEKSLSGPDFKVPTSFDHSGEQFWLVQQEKDEILLFDEPGKVDYLGGIALTYPKRVMTQNSLALILDCEKAALLKKGMMVGQVLLPHPCHTDILAIGPNCGLLLDRVEQSLLYFDAVARVLYPIFQFSAQVHAAILNDKGLHVFTNGGLSFYPGDRSNPNWWVPLALKASPYHTPHPETGCFLDWEDLSNVNLPLGDGQDLGSYLCQQTAFLCSVLETEFVNLGEPGSEVTTSELYGQQILSRKDIKEQLSFRLPVRQRKNGTQPLDVARILEQWLLKIPQTLRFLQTNGNPIQDTVQTLTDLALKALRDITRKRINTCRGMANQTTETLSPYQAVVSDLQIFILNRLQYLFCLFLNEMVGLGSKGQFVTNLAAKLRSGEMIPLLGIIRAYAAKFEPELIPQARSPKEALEHSASHTVQAYLTLISEHTDFPSKVISYLLAEEYPWFSRDGVQVERLPIHSFPFFTQRACFLAGCDTSVVSYSSLLHPVFFIYPIHVAFLSGDLNAARNYPTNNSDNQRLKLMKCLGDLLTGQLKKALQESAEILLKYSKDFLLLYHGFFYQVAGQYEMAESKAIEFLEGCPHSMAGIYLVSLARVCRGRFQDALNFYEDHQHYLSDEPVLRDLLLGTFQRQAGQVKNSIESLEALPSQPMAAYQMGVSHRLLGQEAAALQCFDKEEYNYPCYLNYFQKAVTFLRFGREAAALEALQHLKDHHWFPWLGRPVYKNDPMALDLLRTIAKEESSLDKASAEIISSIAIFNTSIIVVEPYQWDITIGATEEQWLRELLFGGFLCQVV